MILKTDSTRSVRKADDYSKSRYSSAMAEYIEAAFVADGMADEMTGDVDSYGGHLTRVGKWTLHTDEQGFVTATKHTSEQLARASFQRWETEYATSAQ